MKTFEQQKSISSALNLAMKNKMKKLFHFLYITLIIGNRNLQVLYGFKVCIFILKNIKKNRVNIPVLTSFLYNDIFDWLLQIHFLRTQMRILIKNDQEKINVFHK